MDSVHPLNLGVHVLSTKELNLPNFYFEIDYRKHNGKVVLEKVFAPKG